MTTRSEQEILEMLVNTAKNDNRIRAAMINGSRVNPNAQRDIFQDFDIACFVTDIASFIRDPTWIERFGEIMILQMPEAMEDPPPMNEGHFAYLMQFTNGNRIDLTLAGYDKTWEALHTMCDLFRIWLLVLPGIFVLITLTAMMKKLALT